MSAIEAPCFALSPEKDIPETGAGGEMKCFKLPSEETTTSYAISSEIVNTIVENVFDIVLTKKAEPPLEKSRGNIVGDILHNFFSPKSRDNKNDETSNLASEVKQMINEMKLPQESISIKGIGDQLGDENGGVPENLSELPKRNTLERKNRLTNLVRNSKQMLAKLVSGEQEKEVRLSKSEEIHEKLLKVIDLEGNNHYVAPGMENAGAILKIPSETEMDRIELIDEKESDEEKLKGGSLGRSVEGKKGKKKWNLGSKILRYLKRNKEGKKE